MGATTFEVFVTKSAQVNDARAAFRDATSEAKFDRGHGGYTGTIGEKDDFIVVERGLGQREANERAQRMLDDGDQRVNDKWGPAGCIEVVADAPRGRTRTITKTVAARTEQEARTIFDATVRAEAAKLGPGVGLVIEADGLVVSRAKAGTVKPVTTRRGGRPRLYYVVAGAPEAFTALDAAERAARAIATERATRAWGTEAVAVTITKEYRFGPKAEDRALATVTAEPPIHQYKIAARVREHVRTTDVAGWLFFGWASC